MAELIGSSSPTASAGTTLIAGALVFIVLGIIVLVILVVIGVKVVQLIKKRTDVFYRIRSERIKLCSAHRRYPKKISKFRIWKYWKNAPIRLRQFDPTTGKLSLSKPIAYYRGDMAGPEGNLLISFYMPGNNFWYVFPKTELLLINQKQKRKFNIGRDKDGKEQIIERTLPTAKDIVQFDDDSIILNCDGISLTGMFYVPVLHDSENNIIDLSAPAMQSMEEVAISNVFYESLDGWAKATKKAVEANPGVRISQKTGDHNQTVEQNEDFLR